MNRSRILIGLLVMLPVLQGCSSLETVSSDWIQVAGWVRSQQTSVPQHFQFKFRILGEQVSGTLHPLSTQSLNVYSLPTQYSVQARTQSLWVRYWFEFQWQQHDQWHSIKQPLETLSLSQANIIHFVEGEPEIEWQAVE